MSGGGDGEEEEAEEFVVQALAYNNAELLAELVAARPELAHTRDARGRTPLHHAAAAGHCACAEVLLGAGADVDTLAGPADTVRTPLALAAAAGHAPMVQLLIARGADLFYFDAEGHAALQLAQMGAHAECARALLGAVESAHREATDKYQRLCAACVDGDLCAALDILADLGPPSVRRMVLQGSGTECRSVLHVAAQHGRAELARALLSVPGAAEHGTVHEPSGDTVLHAAVSSQDLATVELMLDQFPHLMGVPNLERSLPLHWACRCGHADIVRALLVAKYPANLMKFIEFPLNSNPDSGQGSRSVYMFCCDLNARDQDGRSPFYLAVSAGHRDAVEVLAKFKVPIYDGQNPKAEIDSESADMDTPFLFDIYVNGRTPLMIACANGAIDIVRILLEQCRVDVNLPVCRTGPQFRGAEHGDQHQDADLGGSGALCEAARHGHAEVARVLFAHGAFDYGNRALAHAWEMPEGAGAEMSALLLAQLAIPDRDLGAQKYPAQRHGPAAKHGPMELLSSMLISDQRSASKSTDLPAASTACQLNWKAAGLREVRAEWLQAAGLRLNPQLARHPLGKSLALATLTRLDLSDNNLSSVPHFLFTQLPSLRVLDLAKNAIDRLELPAGYMDRSGSRSGNMWQCPRLDILCLDDNLLEELPAQLFSPVHVPRLRVLSVQRNRVRRLPAAVWSAPRLRELQLSGNKLCVLGTTRPDSGHARGHGQLGSGMQMQGSAGARIACQRQRVAAAEATGSDLATTEGERQSRPTTKRGSPSQHSSRERRGSREGADPGSGRRAKGQIQGAKSTESSSSDGHRSRDAGTRVVELDIVRLNRWQDKIQLSNIDDNATDELDKDDGEKEDGTGDTISRLQMLNLADNKFTRMPSCLACCCPRLVRLDLSGNQLPTLGPLPCLPAALRHLNAARNQLTRIFGGETPAQLRQKLRHCEAPHAISAVGSHQNGAGAGTPSRYSRSRSKSVARSQRSLSVARHRAGIDPQDTASGSTTDCTACVHKSHCRLEALKTLNLAGNPGLAQLELLVPPAGRGGGDAELIGQLLVGTSIGDQQTDADGQKQKQFNWRESGEQLKPYVLFPALTNLDLAQCGLRLLPPTIALLGSLAVLNLAQNAELVRLVPELGLLDRLWNIGLAGCPLTEEEPTLRTMVRAGNYKTGEVLARLRQRLENSVPYPKIKLMLLGATSVGKSTLLQQMRLEATGKKGGVAQNESWSRRMGHSPAKGSSPAQRAAYSAALYPVDVAEWQYEPRRSSKSSTGSPASTADAFHGPITFRTWDFDGIKQREFQSVQLCFFTRRCLFLLLWKVTDGEIALVELHEWLLAIQERAPNSHVLIVGTHSDFVREQPQRFPRDYLAKLDVQIQERFVVGADPEKMGLPRVLGSLYICCRARDDVKSLCQLIYTCAAEIRQLPRCAAGGGPSRQRQLAEKVPASFVALEQIVVTMTDELRASGAEPIMHFNEFWGAVSERLLMVEEGQQKGAKNTPVQFRGEQDFRQACQFLHENGVLCHFDDLLLRDFVFLDPPWLCSLLRGVLAFASSASSPSSATNLSRLHQHSVVESAELYSALRRTLRQHLASLTSAGIIPPQASGADSASSARSRLLRLCAMVLLRKFELALPFQAGRMSLLASCLPDEYLLRADYPGARVRIRNKFDKLKLRWHIPANDATDPQNDQKVPKSPTAPISPPPPITMSPIRSYLHHRRLSRTLATSGTAAASIDEGKIKDKMINGSPEMGDEKHEMARILALDQCKEEHLRRLYVMHYIPPGFWARLATRLMDDERVGTVIAKLFHFTRAPSDRRSDQEEGHADHVNAELISAALSRALNSGRIVNLVRRGSLNHRFCATEEEETSFIVVNPAEEVTEELSSDKLEEDAVMVKCCERGVEAGDEAEADGHAAEAEEAGNGLEWMLWRSGMEVRTLGTFVLALRQFLPLASVPDVNYSGHELRRRSEEGQWMTLSGAASTPSSGSATDPQRHFPALTHIVELLIPKLRVRLRWRDALWELETDARMASRLMALISANMDELLEDCYPQLGTRFILSPLGRPLIDRLIPCDRCAIEAIREEERYWLRENINRNPTACGNPNLPPRPTRSSSIKNLNTKKGASRGMMPKSKSSTAAPLGGIRDKSERKDENDARGEKRPANRTESNRKPVELYLFSVEECIVEARRQLKEEDRDRGLECPRHGSINQNEHNGAAPSLRRMAPDLLFYDMETEWSVPSSCIRRGKLLGHGAFGFVFTGWLEPGAIVPKSPRMQFGLRHADNCSGAVALKVMEPLGPSALTACSNTASTQAALSAFALKWQQDALEQCTRAYCTARQELCMLAELRHPHCTRMIAFCASPITLLMELAPRGSLDKLLAEHRRAGCRLALDTLQCAGVQIARALEYLHVQQHIIYRDLKSENVLVWRFPSPPADSRAKSPSCPRDVLLKLGDYGISRFSHPFGMCKGYGGTEGFMAPEIMRYHGETEYSERVDCFSFGMFLYELVTLRLPYEGQPMQQMKERILEARRPALSDAELEQYSSNVLDTMVACWEERAEARPSASQLVEICSAPEFAHLLDVALLRDGEEAHSLSVLTSNLAEENGNGQWNCWMTVAGKRQKRHRIFALLQCNSFGWTEKKLITVPTAIGGDELSPSKRPIRSGQHHPALPQITAIVQIYDEFVWIGDEAGHIGIFGMAEEGEEQFPWGHPIYTIDAAKVLEASAGQQCVPQQQGLGPNADRQSPEQKHPGHEPLRRASSSIVSHPSAVRQIRTFSERQIVVVGLSSAVLLCRWRDRDTAPQLITSILLGPGHAHHLHAMAVLPSLGDWQIWTGHATGHIVMHHISAVTDRLVYSASAGHFSEKRQNTTSDKKGAVAFLVASNCVKNLVWSTLERDPRVFMWRDAQVQNALNCAKIAPSSESLSSMGESEEENSAAESVTALELVDLWGSDRNDQEQLLVGTGRGLIIVLIARGKEMCPISACRPYAGPVERLISCADARMRHSSSRVLQNELLVTSTGKGQSSPGATADDPAAKKPSVRKKRSLVMFDKASRTGMMKGTTGPSHQQSAQSSSASMMPGGQMVDIRGAVDDICEAVKSGVRGIFASDDAAKTHKTTENGGQPEAHFVSIGRGYRPLLNRFINAPTTTSRNASSKAKREEEEGESVAIFWRTNWHWTQEAHHQIDRTD